MPLRNIPRTILRFISAPVRHWRISLTVLIAFAIAYLIADQVLLSKLAAQREAILASGGHLSLGDFARDIRDSENAAVVYKYAASLLQEPAPLERDRDPASQYIHDDADQPLTAEEEAWVERYIAANGRTFEAILEAVGKPHAQYTDYEASGDLLANPAFAVPEYAHLRALARLTALRAVWEDRHGNREEACRWVGVTLAIGNSISQEPWLIAGLIRAAVHGLALDSLRALVCEQPLPARLPEILTMQLAAAADLAGLSRFYEGERWLSNEMDGRLFAFRPLLTANQLASLKMTTGLIEAVAEPDEARRVKLVQEFQRDMPEPVKPGFPPVFRMHRIIADLTRPALAKSINSLDGSVAEARGAQAVIALKQYKQAHGEYPDELGKVAPEFFKTVPIDPFSGAPLRYRREDNGFTVYSIGKDYRDDGGKKLDGKTGDIVWIVTE